MILLLAAVNELFLGLDTYLAHVLNGTIQPREWIPIIFGAVAGILLLVAGITALRYPQLASWLATAVFLSSIVVGILGAYFHLLRGSLPTAPAGQQLTLILLVWAPPVLAPFAFSLVGILGISAAWSEHPFGSGQLHISSQRRLQLPYSKTQAYYFLVSLGILIALLSSTLDHVRHPWETSWLWAPVIIGVFATTIAAAIATISEPTLADRRTYTFAMILLILVGMIGAYFHIVADLTSQSVIVPERFLRGAPFLAPLLYINMGLLGLFVLWPTQQADV